MLPTLVHGMPTRENPYLSLADKSIISNMLHQSFLPEKQVAIARGGETAALIHTKSNQWHSLIAIEFETSEYTARWQRNKCENCDTGEWFILIFFRICFTEFVWNTPLYNRKANE